MGCGGPPSSWFASTAKDSTGGRFGQRDGRSGLCRDGPHPGLPARLAVAQQEDPEIDLNALIEPNLGVIVAGLTVVCVILVIAVIVLARRTSHLTSRLAGITRGESGKSFEGILEAHLDKIYAVARDLDEVAGRTAALESVMPTAFQRVGLVRYNPFEDTGGNQSFALAMLDARGDGWILSSLHARTGTRFYAKAVTGGRSELGLSEEEQAAIRQATA
jgi:hypothetical protein